MGAEVRAEPNAIEVRGTGRLSALDADLNAISDTAPTLAVLGAFAATIVSR
jgi:5-enolpyruvylshikimate-3-phosphate synthase